MEQLVKEQMERCTISMEPVDWVTVHKVARDMGLASRSAGVRFIIRDWVRMKEAASEQNDGVRCVNGFDDLLAVCQAIYSEVGMGGDLCWHLREGGHADALKAAIAKVTGESLESLDRR